jgi:nicotinamide-nucleotide amidase
MVNVTIITIGKELLEGKTLNTNVFWLSQKISSLGCCIKKHISICDEQQEIVRELNLSSSEELVICTGGLGPTLDDITKKAISDFFQLPLEEDSNLKKELEERYPSALDSCALQSIIPKGAFLLENKAGMAPGMLFKKGVSSFIFLPGVPQETMSIFENGVEKFLKEQFPSLISKKEKSLYFCGLKESQIDPHLRTLQGLYPEMELGIYPSYGYLYVSAKSHEEKSLQLMEETLLEEFGDFYFETSSGDLLGAIHHYFLENGLTLSLAESCTGGDIAKSIVSCEGASEYFQGSIVSYSNFSKQKFLDVSNETLETKGAVSKECVLEMAQGCLNAFDTDYALSISGIAGPLGGSEEKPVGTVWVGLASKSRESFAIEFLHTGIRKNIIQKASQKSLSVLWQYLNKKHESLQRV